MTPTARLSFVLTSAIVAAVLGDAILEAMSNSAIAWHGHYTDGSSLDLLPMALLGASTFAIVIASIVRRDRESARSANRVGAPAPRLLERRDVLRLLPTTLLVQFGALFAMESVEQIVVWGHPLGGSIWLGGPAIPSVLVHATLGLLCSLVFARNVSAVARVVGDLVRAELLVALPRMAAAPLTTRDEHTFATRLMLVSEIGERGPPAR